MSKKKHEHLPCFACDQIMPVGRLEKHHFPMPRRYGGNQTIWLCLGCHDYVDRITTDDWPDRFVDTAVNLGRESKLFLLKLWSMYMDEKNKNKSTEIVT